MPASTGVELELERNVRAPAQARAAIAGRLGELGLDADGGQLLVLLVSELVSNAVRHSTGAPDSTIRLLVKSGARTVRVAVSDGGEGFTPRPRDPERHDDGYGLYILERAAASWGIETDGGTTVWFELPRSVPAGPAG